MGYCKRCKTEWTPGDLCVECVSEEINEKRLNSLRDETDRLREALLAARWHFDTRNNYSQAEGYRICDEALKASAVVSTKKILDLSAGNRHIWFDKNHPAAVYVDVRAEVNPTIVADTKRLPPEIGSGYDLIVFDPPHCNLGKNSRMAKDYGHHTAEEIRSIVAETAKEAWRVSAPAALMAFKWNTHDQKLERILALLAEYREPLFGHIVSAPQRRPSTTYWVMLRRLAHEKTGVE